MFLDRPTNAVVLFNNSLLNLGVGTKQNQITEMEDSLQFGNQTIPIEFITRTQATGHHSIASSSPTGAGTTGNTREGHPTLCHENLTALNYSLQFETMGT